MKKLIPRAQQGRVLQDNTRIDNKAQDKMWGIQRLVDSENLSELEFNEKYPQRKLHPFKMDTDPVYRQNIEARNNYLKQNDPKYTEINLPWTDKRSSNYTGNPNLKLVPGNTNNKARASQEESFVNMTTLSSPLVPIKRIQSILNTTKNITKPTNFSGKESISEVFKTPVKKTSLRENPIFLMYQERKKNLPEDVKKHALDYLNRKIENPEMVTRLKNLGLNDEDIDLGKQIFRNTQLEIRPFKDSSTYGTAFNYGDRLVKRIKEYPLMDIPDFLRQHPFRVAINSRSKLLKTYGLQDPEIYQSNLRATIWHELDHNFKGSFGVQEKIHKLINEAKLKNYKQKLGKFAFNANQSKQTNFKNINEVLDHVNYLASPTEVYSRLGEFRSFLTNPSIYDKSSNIKSFANYAKYFNLNVGYNPAKLRELFNKLPAVGGVGLGTKILIDKENDKH